MLSYFREYFDFYLFFACLVLVVIGLISIYSATYDVNNALSFQRQLIWASCGLVLMLMMAFLPLRLIRRLSPWFYALCLAVLVLVLIFGTVVKGTKGWFGIAGLGGQPSEFAKVATILMFAWYFSKIDISITSIKDFVLGLGIFFLPMLLILIQPDLGTVIVFFLILIPLLFWTGASRFLLLTIISPIASAFASLFGIVPLLIVASVMSFLLIYLHENKLALAFAIGITLAVGLSVHFIYDKLPVYQQRRISAFVNPELDHKGAGYNVIQSKIAIGSGGLFGKGYMKGTQTQLNYIPEQWTDFIFCVPAEEFGFLGASLILLCFVILFVRGLKIASICRNRFASISALGITALLMVQTFINIGMEMGIMPVIGIPLPLMSYGGSALVSDMMMVGLLMNFYSGRKEY